jgi:hypothetical protein
VGDSGDLSDAGWLRLHRLRLQGAHAAPEDDAAAELVKIGYAEWKGAHLAPTPAGRAAHEGWACLPAGSEAQAAARVAYEKFLGLDLQLKKLVHDWQTTAKQSGPLTADEWDLVDKLKGIDGKAGPFLRRLTEAVERFGEYRPRLKHALHQIEEEGDRKFVCGLLVDSYHTVWWQLHEDLLVSTGVSRAEDPNQ